MNEQPKVTIITVTYNIIARGNTEFFRQCVESVHSQKYKNIEHIVVDGNSQDGSFELLSEYDNKGWIRLIREPDEGMYDAMNKGIAASTGEYLAFLNCDDFYNTENAITTVMNMLLHTDADFSYAPVKVIKRDGKQVAHYHENPQISELFFHMPFSHQSLFVKKSCLKKIGMYDTQFKNAGDYDLALRLCLNNCSSILVDKPFVTYRTGGISDIRVRESFDEVVRILLKNYTPLADITENECRELFAKDFSYIPHKLALELKKKCTYFDFDEYVKQTIEALSNTRKVIKSYRRSIIFKILARLGFI